jgi:hypothetical protein
VGSEGDGGREAIHNRYPVAMKPPAGRNAADLSASRLHSDRLVIGSHERLAGLEASSVHWTLWQCRESFNCVFAMQNQTQKPPCATLPTCPLASTQRPLWWLAGAKRATSFRRHGPRAFHFWYDIEIVRRSLSAVWVPPKCHLVERKRNIGRGA